MSTPSKSQQRVRRHARIRAKVFGTPERPRLSVFRSNRYVYAQVIDDVSATTLAAESSLSNKTGSMKDAAREVGKKIAEKAAVKGISQVVFDRGGFIYTGVIREVAEGAREAGLKF